MPDRIDNTPELLDHIQRSHELAAETRRLIAERRQIQKQYQRILEDWPVPTGTPASHDRPGNLLLALMSPRDLQRIRKKLELVDFRADELLHSMHSAVEHVYFPTTGVLSARTIMANGCSLELASIGHDGMVGLTAVAGAGVSPYDVRVQIPGTGFRLSVAALAEELDQNGSLRDILRRYFDGFSYQMALQIACSGLHSVRKRCCRKLLSLHDQLAVDDLPVTHESLAHSLGVRRASVTVELQAMHRKRLIFNSRAHVKLLDRPRLESAACECYQSIKCDSARMFTGN
jgi:CRP-like cAMP-binding protein